jgi:hypothetical protein
MPDTATKAQRIEAAAPTATLWEALTHAQEQFGPLIKNTKGARGKYAPLDAVLDMVRGPLNDNGIFLTQPTCIEGETLMVRTVLVHQGSGETHECAYPAGLTSLQHQQLGAGVTYARRYSLLSLLGVFPENEDDDGEKAGPAGGARSPVPLPRQQEPDRLNASQAKKAGVWDRFMERLQTFTDVDDLERWFTSAPTQTAVCAMPNDWPELAQEAYEKKHEALTDALRS